MAIKLCLSLLCRCSLEPNLIDVGCIDFGTACSYTVSLKNQGAVDATYYFVPPPRPRSMKAEGRRVTWDDNQPICPGWLAVAPEEGTVEAGGLRCRSVHDIQQGLMVYASVLAISSIILQVVQ